MAGLAASGGTEFERDAGASSIHVGSVADADLPSRSILASCARPSTGPETALRLRRNAHRIDLELLEHADARGLLPLLHLHLKLAEVELPTKVGRTLALRSFAHAQRSLAQAEALGQVLTAAADSDLRPLVVGGAALAPLVYPEPATRSMNDVELLVAGHELESVHSLMAALALRRWEESTPSGVETVFELRGARDTPVRLVVHEALPREDWSWDDLGAERTPLRIGTVPASTLGVEAMLLHLERVWAHRRVSRSFVELRSAADLIGWAERWQDSLDWQRLLEQRPLLRAVFRRLRRGTELDPGLAAALELPASPDPERHGIPGRRQRVKVIPNWTTSEVAVALWSRQSRGHGRWEEVEITATDDDIDAWVIVNHPAGAEHYEPERTVVLAMEPPGTLPKEWEDPDPARFLQVRHHRRFGNTIEWHLGQSYAELRDLEIDKTAVLSTVTSSKREMPGQQLRVDFLHHLEQSGVEIDIFGADNGAGFRRHLGSLPDHDKSRGILPYRYTFAAENSSHPNYFTEKVVDAILGEALCFYWGCPNLEEHLDPRAFIRLPLHDFEASRALIERSIEENEWEKRLPVLLREKRRILDQLQLFPSLDRTLRSRRIVDRVPVRVINLDRRPDRWESLQQRVRAAAGGRFAERCRRVSAVDGSRLEITPALRHLFRHNVFSFRRGIVACALSHIDLWREAAAAEGPTLILEDDVDLRRGFEGELTQLFSEMEREAIDFDLVLLGLQPWHQRLDARVSEPDPTPLRVAPMDWSLYMGGTFAYLLSPLGAARLLDLVERDGIQEAIDWFVMRKAPELAAYRAVPALAESPVAAPGHFGDSDIQHDLQPLKEMREDATRTHEEPFGTEPSAEESARRRLRQRLDDLGSELGSVLDGGEQRIPAVGYFIHLDGGRPFGLVDYLAVRSAFEVQCLDRLLLLTDREPEANPWWRRAAELVTVVTVEPVTRINRREIPYLQHRADVLRLEILRRWGGVYFDTDVLSLRPLGGLLDERVVMAREQQKGLCNCVILARPRSPFIEQWAREYEIRYGEEGDDWWAGLSVVTPLRLARWHREELCILPQSAFMPFLYGDDSIYRSTGDMELYPDSYAIHLWATEASGRGVLPTGLDYFEEHDNAFTTLFRPYVEDLLARRSSDAEGSRA